MAKNGVPAAIAAYAPVLAALGAIVFSEWRWTYRFPVEDLIGTPRLAGSFQYSAIALG